jgi:heptosyltransferase-1
MRLLIVKTSSLGDVIHTLPAITDAQQHYPDLEVDWIVEENFAEIPTWHPAVKRVIPIALRRWRKQIWQTLSTGIWHNFIQKLQQQKYDKIIDAQGLLKSAFITYKAQGNSCGFDFKSARESLAALVYQQSYNIPKNQHAVTRLRQLFAAALSYTPPKDQPNYGIIQHFQPILPKSKIIFLHGTTWQTKHWPYEYWVKLAHKMIEHGFEIAVPWGNAQEYKRAQKLAAISSNIHIIAKSTLYNIAKELTQAKVVIGVDTGLAHLVAALNIPSITLYGATAPSLTGTYGLAQTHLQVDFACAPCFNKKCTYRGATSVSPSCYQTLSPEKVIENLNKVIIK